MCDPVTLTMASMGIAVGAQVANYAGQAKSANAQASYENARYSSVSESALHSYMLETTATQKREEQEEAATSQTAEQIKAQGESQVGAYTAQAASSGIGGNTVHALMDQFSGLEATNQRINSTNLDWKRQQLQSGLAGYQAQTQQYISGAAPAPVSGPSTAGLLLGIGSSGLGAVDKYLQYTGTKLA